MTSTVTTHPSSVGVARIGALTTLATSVDGGSMSLNTCVSLPSSPVTVTGMSGLLSSRHLVQDEKLVVATLATLNSGSASSLIKQDLKWIIQSRRKAEGKAELQVEFKKPVKDQLTSEELIKRARRRELNRLAARRSREKGQRRKDMLVEEIRKLQSQNSELVGILGDLTEERDNIVLVLRQHMKQCSDFKATQSAAVGMSQKVLDLLGFPSMSPGEVQVQAVSDLYINTGDSCSSSHSQSHSQSQSPCLVVKQETSDMSSCPSSPLMVGVGSSQLIEVKQAPMPGGADIYDNSFISPSLFSLHSPQLNYSIPLVSLQFESPPLLSAISKMVPARSCTHSSDETSIDGNTAVAAAVAQEEIEDEVIHYKHKLMKHRKQLSQVSQSSSLVSSRGNRVSLERSFSFPSTARESRSSVDSAPGSDVHVLESCEILGTPTTRTLVASSQAAEAVGYPLDLAVKKASTSCCSSSPDHMFPMDTWPPARMRSAPLRNLERRWSVDQSLPEPLNLSSRDQMDGEHWTQMTTTTSSSINISRYQRQDSQHSHCSVDTYR